MKLGNAGQRVAGGCSYPETEGASFLSCQARLTPEFAEVMSAVTDFISEAVEQTLASAPPPCAPSRLSQLFARLRPGASHISPPAGRLGPEQLGMAFQVALQKARQLGLTEEQARCLAEAVVGRPGSD